MRTDITHPTQQGAYVNERICMLEEQFKISLTKEEKQHLHELATEISVDNFVRDIIRRKL